MTQTDLSTVPGLPETSLTAPDLDELRRIEDQIAPAPWVCRARAVIWLQRATHPRFGWRAPTLPIAFAGFVEYLDTPVGPYHEVLAAAALRQGLLPIGQVPFIAVDSMPSVLGGRANWGLPKTMAEFSTDIPAGRAEVHGDGWAISVEPVRSGTARWRMPIWSSFRCTGPLGTYRGRIRGRGRLLRVRTQVDGPQLSRWLGSGTHLALELSGTMRIDAPVTPA